MHMDSPSGPTIEEPVTGLDRTVNSLQGYHIRCDHIAEKILVFTSAVVSWLTYVKHVRLSIAEIDLKIPSTSQSCPDRLRL
jgi:hypothetical protein